MSDEGGDDFDPCACIWNHDMVMQRLLSILRQSQAYCTDHECLSLQRMPSPGNAPNDCDFMMIIGFSIMVLLLYIFRPNSLRQSETKSRDSDSDSDSEPPTPPAVY